MTHQTVAVNCYHRPHHHRCLLFCSSPYFHYSTFYVLLLILIFVPNVLVLTPILVLFFTFYCHSYSSVFRSCLRSSCLQQRVGKLQSDYCLDTTLLFLAVCSVPFGQRVYTSIASYSPSLLRSPCKLAARFLFLILVNSFLLF